MERPLIEVISGTCDRTLLTGRRLWTVSAGKSISTKKMVSVLNCCSQEPTDMAFTEDGVDKWNAWEGRCHGSCWFGMVGQAWWLHKWLIFRRISRLGENDAGDVTRGSKGCKNAWWNATLEWEGSTFPWMQAPLHRNLTTSQKSLTSSSHSSCSADSALHDHLWPCRRNMGKLPGWQIQPPGCTEISGDATVSIRIQLSVYRPCGSLTECYSWPWWNPRSQRKYLGSEEAYKGL